MRVALLAIALVTIACKHRHPPPPILASADDLFEHRLVPIFELTLSEESLASLSDKQTRKKHVPAAFVHGGERLADVGVRLKGNRSLQGLGAKPSFKVRFDKFVEDQRFRGLRGFTLNNLVEDSTLLRETFAYRLYRAMGVPAPRTGFAELLVNGESYGLYLVVEEISKELLARGAGDDGKGNLYEGEFGCDLHLDDAARFEQDGGKVKDHADLVALASLPRADLWKAFDRKRVLAYLAVAAVIGDFDGYRHGHNYRLYHGAGGWSLLPWGQDRTFKRSLGLTDSGGVAARVCFADPACRQEYAAMVRAVADQLDALRLPAAIDTLAPLIDPVARRDPRRPYDAKEIGKERGRLRKFLSKRPAEVREQLACFAAGVAEDCDRTDDDCDGSIDDVTGGCACRPVTIGTVEFELCDLPMTWQEAADLCKAHGRTLARIDDETQSQALFEAAVKLNKDAWWIGLSDRETEGTFRWVDGTPVGKTVWKKGQPDDASCGEDCAVLRRKGKGRWTDGHCGNRHPFVCRR